jgi:acetyl/propionyl-CoA carboxylase alpha subunit
VISNDSDIQSKHVTAADEAISLGSINQEQDNPFLNISLIVEVAKRASVQATHPGYGYLSENPPFADTARSAANCLLDSGRFSAETSSREDWIPCDAQGL